MPWKRILIFAGILGVAIQWIPVDRDNPPVTQEVAAPLPVLKVLRRSCYDCHSNQTRWPWYAHVAPVSWLVAYDVHHARHHVNFSTWDQYSAKDLRHAYNELEDVLENDAMPLAYYLPLHPEAALSASDLALLQGWLQSREPPAHDR